MKSLSLTPIAALLLATAPLLCIAQTTTPAQAPSATQDKKGVSPAEMNYQAGTSPLAGEAMYQSVNPKAPPMTVAEFDSARKIYF